MAMARGGRLAAPGEGRLPVVSGRRGGVLGGGGSAVVEIEKRR